MDARCDDMHPDEPGDHCARDDRTIFDVKRIWKSEYPADPLAIAPTGSLCDIAFRSGETYVVFAYYDVKRKSLYTSKCSMTQSVAANADLLKMLDEHTFRDLTRQQDFFTMSCGDGIDGTRSVQTIFSDGRRWAGSEALFDAEANPGLELPVDQALADAVFDTLAELDLDGVDGTREFGDWSCSIIAKVNDRRYESTWTHSDSETLRQLDKLGEALGLHVGAADQ